MVGLHGPQRQRLGQGKSLQPPKGLAVHRQRPRRQAAFDAQVGQVALDVRIGCELERTLGCGCVQRPG
jgi:hypothetical protein